MTDYIVISPEYFKPRRAPSGLAKAIRQTCEATRYRRAGMTRRPPPALFFGMVAGRKILNIFYYHISKPYFFIQKRVAGHKMAQKRHVPQQAGRHCFTDHTRQIIDTGMPCHVAINA